eukprot:3097419-Lingulodinium_polyedra.AAC.1
MDDFGTGRAGPPGRPGCRAESPGRAPLATARDGCSPPAVGCCGHGDNGACASSAPADASAP